MKDYVGTMTGKEWGEGKDAEQLRGWKGTVHRHMKTA
jgi:hypothetical protein